MGIRSKWFVVTVVAGAVAVTPLALRQLSPDRPTPTVDPPIERVRVEHELVTPDVIEPVRVVSAGVVTPKVSVRAVTTPVATPRRPAVTPAGAPTFAQKARRAFLGDGRHRPQPFPTVR
jgi:hypothetical protein